MMEASSNSVSVPIYGRHKSDFKTGQTNTYQQAISKYVSENFKHLECNEYIEDPESTEPNVCFCGRHIGWHRNRHVRSGTNGKVWNPSKSTREMEPDTFGEILFGGFGRVFRASAPYIRIAHDTDVRKMWFLLEKYWNMKPPKLLISITGGAKLFSLNAKLLNIFKRSLIKAATSTDAWIVTGGTNAGVMKYVGEAVRDSGLTSATAEHRMVAIGIATWGIVDNRAALVSDGGKGNFPAEYNIEKLKPQNRNVAPLDYNHTHFILVDDGSENRYGREIEFRTSFVKHISEQTIKHNRETTNQDVTVPVVLLVVEGGPNTLRTVASAVEKNTPVVVVAGSGRAADFIAEFDKKFKAKDGAQEGHVIQSFEDDICARASSVFSGQKFNMDTIKEDMAILEKKRKLITVFSLDDEESPKDIDEAILSALLTCGRFTVDAQLELALAWDRCDVARKGIFKIDRASEWQKKDLSEAIFNALVENRVDFVKLFLDSGVDLKKFLSVRRLRDLYVQLLEHSRTGGMATLLDDLLQYVQKTWQERLMCCESKEKAIDRPDFLNIVGRLLKYLTVTEYKNPYTGEDFVVKQGQPNIAYQDIMAEGAQTNGAHQRCENGTKENRANVFLNHTPERALFLWATLFNRRELAELFWKNGRDQIGVALLASALLKSLSREAATEELVDLSISLKESSGYFERLSVAVLGKCYQLNNAKAKMILERKQISWDETTLLTLAESAELMEFIGHSCCQIRLTEIWMGDMAIHTPRWKIITGIVMPFIVKSIKFNGNKECVVTSIKKTLTCKKEDESDGDNRDEDGQNDMLSKTRKLRKVKWNQCTSSTICLPCALHSYYTAPIMKCLFYTFTYLMFLGVFSFFMLTDLRPVTATHSPSVFEYLTWVYAGSIVIEEVRQLIARDAKSLRYKLWGYIENTWNKFDVLMCVLLVLSIILRYNLSPESFIYARMSYSITWVMFTIRFLQIFYMEKTIGPKVVMVREMLSDLTSFIAIMATFLIAYGVAAHSLQYPNAPAKWKLLQEVLYQPYWNIYGEFFNRLEGEESCSSSNSTHTGSPYCPQSSWLVTLMFAIYMILTNVLLLNLLIAMFSYTFQRVQDNSEKVWRYYRYNLIQEYKDRPALAPPLIVVCHIYRMVKFLLAKCRGKDDYDSTAFSEEDNKKLMIFEMEGMECYLLQCHLESKELIDSKVSNAGERIEKVIEELEVVKEQVSQKPNRDATHDRIDGRSLSETLDAIAVDTTGRSDGPGVYTSSLEPRIAALENQLQSNSIQLAKQSAQITEQSKELRLITDLLRQSNYLQRQSLATQHLPAQTSAPVYRSVSTPCVHAQGMRYVSESQI